MFYANQIVFLNRRTTALRYDGEVRCSEGTSRDGEGICPGNHIPSGLTHNRCSCSTTQCNDIEVGVKVTDFYRGRSTAELKGNWIDRVSNTNFFRRRIPTDLIQGGLFIHLNDHTLGIHLASRETSIRRTCSVVS